MKQDSLVQIFLETERLVLRRFTEDDVDDLVALDGDPEVMRFITGGRQTPRREIENGVLPAFLRYYERFAGYGFWAQSRSRPGDSGLVSLPTLGSGPGRRGRARLPATKISVGQGVTPRKARGR